MKVLVTGAAGLVGSSLCRLLISREASVFAVDNLSLGTKRHLAELESHSSFEFEQWDVSERSWHEKLKGRSFDLIVHLAANSDISLGRQEPYLDFTATLQTTQASLVAAKELRIPNFIFSSTSAVYGAKPVFPTPELTPGMHPVSLYGAGKLASESFISAFVENYGINAWVYRFGNVVGQKLTHGVIYDFVKKLRANPATLQVLGNGTQNKTYIDVEDCVNGILYGFEKSPAGKTHEERFQIFNLSTEGATSVREIAEETVRVVTGGKTRIEYGKDPIGWVGDVPKTRLAVDKVMSLGWLPQRNSTTAVFQSIKDFSSWYTE